MALLNIGEDPWLVEYESCEKLQRDIMEQLAARQKEPKASELYTKLSANIYVRLKQYSNEVEQLMVKLEQQIGAQNSITYDEIERRQRQVELLKSKSLQMHKMFNLSSTAVRDDRIALLGVSDDDDDELLDSSTMSIAELERRKQEMLREQETGLENLSKTIARQKNIAEAISSEVNLHNVILDDLGNQITQTDIRINAETSHVTSIDRRDTTCAYWIAIVLLFVSILVVSFAF